MADGEEHTPTRTGRRRHRVTRVLTWIAATAIGCSVVLVLTALLAVKFLESEPQRLAGWLSDYLNREVSLRELELVWSSATPALRIYDFKMVTNAESGQSLSLDTTEVRLDLRRSIAQRSLHPQAIIVRGAQVSLERDPQGNATIAGLGLGQERGQEGGKAMDTVLADLLSALPKTAMLGVEQATVTLRESGTSSQPGRTLVLFPVSARLSRDNDDLRISANAALRDHRQARIHSTVRWRAQDRSPLAAAEFTLSASALPIAALPQQILPFATDGQISLAIDGQIVDQAVDSLRGTVKLSELDGASGNASLRLNAAESLLEYVRDDSNWRLTLLRLQTHSTNGPSTPGTLTLTGPLGSAPRSLSLDHLSINALLPLLSLLAPESDLFGRMLPVLSSAGRIEDVQADLSGELFSLRLDELRLRARDAIVHSDHQQIRIGPLDASIVTDGRSGSITMQASPVRLDLGAGEQQQPRQANFFASGTLSWMSNGDGMLVSTDGVNIADGQLRMRITGSARIPDSSPHMELNLDLQGAGLDEQTFKRYLALDFLPLELNEWLSESILAGQLRDFHAQLKGVPASALEIAELLTLDASFENATLRYLDDWPELTALTGRFSMQGKAFSISVDSGRAGKAHITSTRGRIADVLHDNPVLALQGRARGPAEQGAAFISATPLGSKFSPLLDQLAAQGTASLSLDVTVPLSTGDIAVSGKLKLHNNQLQVRALRSALTDVGGTISFDAQGLTRAALNARYLGRKISMSLDGLLDQRTRTQLFINGATDPQGLLKHLYDVGALDSIEPAELPLLGRLSGEADWQLSLDFVQRTSRDQTITMTVSSDLKGMALKLPPPLGKSRQETRALEIRSTLLGGTSNNRRFQVRYGDALHSILEMAPQSPEGYILQRGVLHLGNGDATLTPEPGFWVSGSVDVISVDEWAALITESEGQSADDHRKRRRLDNIKSVKINAKRLVALGATFDDVALDVTHDPRGPWRIATKGTGIDGVITINKPIGMSPIEARFERLHVRQDSDFTRAPQLTDPVPIDPGSVPSARVVVQRLRYNDIELGLAKLTIEPHANELVLNEIFALGEAFEIRGTGRWSGPANNARSSFDLRLHSNNFGQLTSALGYADSGIEGGVAEIAIDANWSGSPFAFALNRIKGELHFRGTGGRLRDVEPGATGRVFGLFNLTVLPRRLLLLDFKDLFEEGVSYELIEGSFALADGNAITDNVVMHTQTAKVALEGRVGLIAQDYDQVMTVTPKLSASLPLAPIWLAEQLLNRTLIDNAFAYQYIISGSWLDPQVERVRIEVPVSEANEDR
ncbi:MAG: hypothetical protein ACI9DC_004147 [Gammaproteobacteria bacterium]|jgi:uncharacterized protein (TIGR02099 family)